MELIFLDIDFTILRPQSKLAVIDKDDPSKIIFRIEPSQASLMNTYWKKYNLQINYNGKVFWISPDFLENIKRIKKGIDLARIGITDREWTSEEILKKQKNNIEFILHNLKFLKGKNAGVILLTAREAKNNHQEFIKRIKAEIADKLKLTVIKEYFVNDMVSQTSSDLTANRKAKILLEHLIGFKIKRNKFIETTQMNSNNLYFFDDDSKNIEAANNLQEIFEKCLAKTQADLKEKILKRIEDIELKITSYLATNNDINPFIVNDIVLIKPFK